MAEPQMSGAVGPDSTTIRGDSIPGATHVTPGIAISPPQRPASPRVSEKSSVRSEGTKFFSRWRKFVPAIAYHHILMILLAISIILQSLVLGSCTSTSHTFRESYILSVSYNTRRPVNEPGSITASTEIQEYLRNVTDGVQLEARVGFFGICVHESRAIRSEADWMCDASQAMVTRYSRDESAASADPLGLVAYVAGFSAEVVFYGLIIASIILSFLSIVGFATFPGWHTETTDDGSEHEVKQFPSRAVSQAIACGLTICTMFSFVSTIWVHVGAVAAATTLDLVYRGLVVTHIGWLPLFLSWLAVALHAIVLAGTIIMILSIQLLDRLTDDD